jgi:hypothetical protein
MQTRKTRTSARNLYAAPQSTQPMCCALGSPQDDPSQLPPYSPWSRNSESKSSG